MSVTPTRTRIRAAHVLRGSLIGAAEAVPGVSGGTVALVTGVYETIIGSAGHLVSGVRALATDRVRARAEFRAVRWDVLVPLLIGMAPTLVVALLLLGPAVERYPVQTRALFFGMVAAALVVPVRLLGTPRLPPAGGAPAEPAVKRPLWAAWRPRELLLAGLAAIAAFLFMGELHLSVEPRLPVVFLAAAVAVCALVLPGVSGAFLLLAFGLYVPTSEAVRDVDLAYIGTFGLGAVVGLSLVVKGLQWLLAHRRRVTLVAMTGLIVGALRALWPWQTEEEHELAPVAGEVAGAVGLCLLGVAVVVGVLVLEHRLRDTHHRPAAPDPVR